VLLPDVGVGLKLAVTPLGKPAAVKATLPVNPPVRVIVILLVPLAPWLMVRLAGLADNEKSAVATGFTVKAIATVWLRLPLVPVTVTVAAPVAALLDAARVSVVLLPVVGVGLKLAVTPAGKPLAVNPTLPVNPPVRVIVIVLVPLAPWPIVRLPGLADNEKSAGATGLTVSAMVAVWLRLPLVPVTVTVDDPVVAVLEALSVSVVAAPLDVGLKVAVTPAGRPLALNATLPAKPPAGVTEMVLVPLDPWVTDKLVGLDDSEKSGGNAPAMSPYMIPRPLVAIYTRP